MITYCSVEELGNDDPPCGVVPVPVRDPALPRSACWHGLFRTEKDRLNRFLPSFGKEMQAMEQEFVQRFAEVWKHPSPERLVALLHPDVVLYQPQSPAIRGTEAARREFQRLFHWLPDLCGDVERWCGANGVVFIEWHMRFPIGRGLAIRAVDRFVLQEGLGIERAVYFNQLPLLAAVVSHPQVWPGFIHYRFGRG